MHVEAFRTHEIDGKALLLLSTTMLMKYLGLKLGPALKICNIIDKLKVLVVVFSTFQTFNKFSSFRVKSTFPLDEDPVSLWFSICTQAFTIVQQCTEYRFYIKRYCNFWPHIKGCLEWLQKFIRMAMKLPRLAELYLGLKKGGEDCVSRLRCLALRKIGHRIPPR